MEHYFITPSESYELYNLFLPSLQKRKNRLKENKTRLVHYTSTTAGMSILKNKEMWMRNVADMNDFKEVDYARDFFLDLADEVKDERETKFDLKFLFTGSKTLSELIEDKIWELAANKKWRSYITCFSEHDDNVDDYGQLSMWRGYGKDGGVAFVLNQDIFLRRDRFYVIKTVPVEYLDYSEFKMMFKKWVNNLRENRTFINECWGKDPECFETIFNYCLETMLISIKHVGFKEEKEWRVVFSSSYEDISDLKQDIVINKYPQIIYKLPLIGHSKKYSAKIPINDVLDRIIIGPNPHVEQVYFAYVKILEELGIDHPAERVVMSNIPYRAW